MKRSSQVILSLVILVSCVEEVPKAGLLEFKINNQLYSYQGSAYRYNDFADGLSKAYEWHIFNSGQNAIYIQAIDTTFKKYSFPVPASQAKYTITPSNGGSKTYEASSGELRLFGEEMGDIAGDFNFTLKEITNPDDSVVITDGYFRIWLQKQDRILPE